MEEDKYIETFKLKTLIEKKEMALNQLNLIILLVNEMNKGLKTKNNPQFTNSFNESINGNCTEEAFVEAVLMYAGAMQDLLCSIVNRISDLMEEKIIEP